MPVGDTVGVPVAGVLVGLVLVGVGVLVPVPVLLGDGEVCDVLGVLLGLGLLDVGVGVPLGLEVEEGGEVCGVVGGVVGLGVPLGDVLGVVLGLVLGLDDGELEGPGFPVPLSATIDPLGSKRTYACHGPVGSMLWSTVIRTACCTPGARVPEVALSFR